MKRILLIASVLGFHATVSKGAITWGSATNIPTSDVAFTASVANSGTFLSAINFGVDTASTTTINGVTFTGSGTYPVGSAATTPISGSGANGTGWTLSPYQYSTTLTTIPQTLGGSVGNVATSLLDNFISGSGSGGTVPNNQAFTLTFTGLQIGEAYRFQIWVTDSRSNTSTTQTNIGGGGPTLDNNISNTTGVVGQYVVGTFIAGSSTESLTYQSSSNAYGPLNAFSFFQIPEPSSALLAVGLAAGIFKRRRH
jgi:hypothetical protein